MFAERDKHYPSRSGQTSLATSVTKFTKPVTKNNFGPSTVHVNDLLQQSVRSTPSQSSYPVPLILSWCLQIYLANWDCTLKDLMSGWIVLNCADEGVAVFVVSRRWTSPSPRPAKEARNTRAVFTSPGDGLDLRVIRKGLYLNDF